MTKSHVTLEQHVCPVCGVNHDTGTLMLHRRLRKSFEPKTVTGISLCPEHLKLHQDGFVALVEVLDPPPGTTKLTPMNANRTGRICHVRRSAAKQIFNVPVINFEFVYCDMETINKIETIRDEIEAASNAGAES